MKTDQDKSEIISRYAGSEKDTGSIEVQIGLLTNRIKKNHQSYESISQR